MRLNAVAVCFKFCGGAKLWENGVWERRGNNRTQRTVKTECQRFNAVAADDEPLYSSAQTDNHTHSLFSIDIANCLLKQHQEPEKRSYKDEDSQQLFASKRSTCVQWDCIPTNTAAEKSVPASIFLRFDIRLLFYETPRCP